MYQKQYNDKNLFIYFNCGGQSCYTYIAGVCPFSCDIFFLVLVLIQAKLV